LRSVVDAAEAGRADTTSPERGSRELDHKISSESGEKWSFFASRFSTSKQIWQPHSETPQGPSLTTLTRSQPPSADDPLSSRLPTPSQEEAQQQQPLLARLNPLALKHEYRSAGSTGGGESAGGKGRHPYPEQRVLISGDEGGESAYAAVIQGSNGTVKNVLYTQDGPMAPAWVLRGITKGHVGRGLAGVTKAYMRVTCCVTLL
jgi:hypothetical protein